jgi:methionyl-tRNA formyltransferase
VKSCPVKHEALKADLKIFQPEKVKDPEFINGLKTMIPDAIVVVAYGQILPPEIIHLPRLGCINIHASLLPKYRGAAPINWAVINGEKKTGITTMLMDEGMDTGPILLQEETEIRQEHTAGSLSRVLSEMGADLLMTTLQGLEGGKLKPQPQTGEASCAPMLEKSDGFMQWNRPAEALFNFVRGMNPWPGAYGFLEGERIKILKALPLSGEGGIGVIERTTKDELVVGTGKGSISIIEIQPPGKQAMTIKAFLQGRRLEKGMRFDLDGKK